MIDRSRFPHYGYICSIIAFLFFIFHFLFLVDLCPYGISTVIRFSFIQIILAILSIYFGCCGETKKEKLSIFLGVLIIIILILYSIFVIYPCLD
jgi:hypothetical protein